ncbi:MAG: hypothetical protein K5641_00775 [Lachnospiraceae bacterium]|nr:hypothetical protein [Lachnospiraceae bacterium]
MSVGKGSLNRAAKTKTAESSAEKAPAKKAEPAKKTTPAKKAVPAKKAAPAKKAEPAAKAEPVKKAKPKKPVILGANGGPIDVWDMPDYLL